MDPATINLIFMGLGAVVQLMDAVPDVMGRLKALQDKRAGAQLTLEDLNAEFTESEQQHLADWAKVVQAQAAKHASQTDSKPAGER